MKKIFLIILTVCFFACNSQDNSFEISGIILNSNGETIILSELTQTEIIDIDSAIINDKGYFMLQGETQYPQFYILKTGSNNYVTLIINPGDEIKIQSDIKDLGKNYQVSGSLDSRLMKELNRMMNIVSMKLDSLGKIYQENISNPNIQAIAQELDMEYLKIKENLRNQTFAFIEKNSGSLASLMALYMQLTPRENVLDPATDYSYFQLVDSVLFSKYPEASSVKMLHGHVADIKMQLQAQQLASSRLAIGTVAPDIKLPTPQGDSLALSSLRGKYVLLDFWAAWCGPCRLENPNLVLNYQKFQDKGFTIYQVSLDRTKEAWLQGISEDGLTWHHVSDLGFWNSSVVPLYNIQGIPMNFLLDKEGKIIDKNLRGEALGQRLEELFK